MKRIPILLAFVALMGGLYAPVAAQGGGFVVIVNTSNGVDQLSKDDVAKLFTKREQRWPNGQNVMPVDLTESSNVREQFTASVHGKSVSAIKSYWQRQIFSGRNVPPPELNSDADVVAFVRSNPSAIGYVSANTALGSGVKSIRVTAG